MENKIKYKKIKLARKYMNLCMSHNLIEIDRSNNLKGVRGYTRAPRWAYKSWDGIEFSHFYIKISKKALNLINHFKGKGECK